MGQINLGGDEWGVQVVQADALPGDAKIERAAHVIRVATGPIDQMLSAAIEVGYRLALRASSANESRRLRPIPVIDPDWMDDESVG